MFFLSCEVGQKECLLYLGCEIGQQERMHLNVRLVRLVLFSSFLVFDCVFHRKVVCSNKNKHIRSYRGDISLKIDQNMYSFEKVHH